MAKKQKQLTTLWISKGVISLVSVVIAVVFVLNAAVPARAADGINKTINFQGKLVDNNGLNVADGNYTVVFTLYDASSAGSNLWDETQTVSTIDGIFQVALGSVDTTISAVNFNSDQLYLGIKVGADAEMTPRIRFAAVPYAFNSTKVNGLTVTNTSNNPFASATTLKIADGKTVIVNNGLTLAGTDSTTITFQGTDTYVGRTTNDIMTNKTIGSTGLTFSGATTDITSATNEDLTFTPNGFGDLILSSDFDSGVSIGASSNTAAPLSVSGGIGSNASLIVNNTNSGDLFVASQAGTTRFRVANNGDVVLGAGLNANGSIGTGAQCLLGGATASWGTCGSAGTNQWNSNSGLLYNGNLTTDFAIGGLSSASAKFLVSMSGVNPTASVAGLTSNAAFLVDNRGNGDLFAASSSGLNRFVIKQNGNVGIGTTTPGNKLQVVGNVDAFDGGTQGTTLSSTGGIEIAQTANSAFIDFKSSTAEDYDARIEAYGSGLAFRTGGSATQRHLFDANGLVGLNTVTPLATLDVRGANGTIPAASISARTSFAAMVVNNSGSGDIMTASSGGLTRFTLANNGSALFQGDTFMAMGSGGTTTNSSALVNATGDQGTLVPNSGFESAVSGVTFADGWIKDATSSATVTRDTSAQAKGTASVKIQLTNTNAAIYSACMAIAGSTPNTTGYNLNWYARATAPIPTVRVVLDTYTSKANCQSNTANTPSTVAQATNITNAWAKYGTNTTAIAGIPAAATWARVHIQVACTVNCTNSIVNIDGIRFIESNLGGGVDYAENYTGDENNLAVPADVVSMKLINGKTLVVPASSYMDNAVIGVVSTEPGIVLDDNKIPDPKVTVALAGRIPTKVSTKNGAINVGDYLASSDIPGVAVKAMHAGPVIGQALEAYAETDTSKIGKVVMFVKNTYYNGFPLSYNSGLTQAGTQGDIELLGQLIGEIQAKSASASSILSQVTADRVVAGLSIVAPQVTADTVQANTFEAATGKDIAMNLSDDGSFVINNASGEAGITFKNNGDANFAGTITANKLVVNTIELSSDALIEAMQAGGLEIFESILTDQELRITNLENLFASASATETVAPIASESAISLLSNLPVEEEFEKPQDVFKFQNLPEDDAATLSGKLTVDTLHVTGSTIIEGLLHVVDFITARNLIVDEIATFMGKAVFNSDVYFAGRPTFNSDTAGLAVIKRGSKRVTVQFEKEYDIAPMVTANLTLDEITPMPSEELKNLTKRQEQLEKHVLGANTRYIVTKRTTKGFTIVLDKQAVEDLTFSWIAITVDNPVVYKGNGDNQQSVSTQVEEKARPISSISLTITPTSSMKKEEVEELPSPKEISSSDQSSPEGFDEVRPACKRVSAGDCGQEGGE